MAKQSFDESMLTPVENPIDKLEDLTNMEIENMREWENSTSSACCRAILTYKPVFNSKYILCGAPPGGVMPSDGYHSRTIAAHEPEGTTTAS